MSLNQTLIAELKSEAANTRKVLECVPIEKNDWKPHQKSMTLGRLATHVAESPGWVMTTMNRDVLDFSRSSYQSHTAKSTEELLDILDRNVNEAVRTLENTKEEDFDKMWTLRNGELRYFTLPKKVVLQTYAFDHNFHHRAQLGVYLRLLNVPFPGIYGAAADDSTARNAAKKNVA